MCPKHDVELVAEDPRAMPGPALGPRTSWVTVARFPHSLAAAAARIRLEAEEIPTFLEGERMGSPAMYRVATGGVKLQVPAEFAADARILLSQDWSLPKDDFDDDLDEAWDDPHPERTPSRGWIIEVVIVLALASPAILWLVAKLFTSRP
ncbi:MAG TPA: hypothetical protein VFF52_17785 [Isosphaeraceae bacterium]|nr:hypothetical protein [Isosphaeraceae bacterium]